MTDLRFDERCPCGATISVSGFSHLVKEQIHQWHNTHDKHANSIARAIVGTKEKRSSTWPTTSTFYGRCNPSGHDPIECACEITMSDIPPKMDTNHENSTGR